MPPARRPSYLKPPPVIPQRLGGRRSRLLPRLLILAFLGLVVGGGLMVFLVTRVGGGAMSSGYLALDIRGEVPEEAPTIVFGKPALTARELDHALEQGAKLDRIKGVILRLQGSPGSFARLQALRRSLHAFRKSGKKVVAFMESASLGEYYLAAAADEVVIVPTGDLQLAGIAVEAAFLRGTFDKIGIEPDLYHVGRYKSYSETFTETGMTDGQREVTNALLDDLYGQILKAVAKDRGLSESDVRAAIDDGPFTAKEALARKLVDRIAYWDEVEDTYKDAGDDEIDLVSPRTLSASSGMGFGAPRIALVYGTGQIQSGKSVEDPFGGRAMGSDTIAGIIHDIRQDDAVKAVVLRVDSPGGSGLASDVIWREVEKLKDAGKSVVVSMGDVAASGGYYVACGADVIVAEEGTLTGSIGVVSGKFALKGLYEKIGYNTEIITRGRNAAIYTNSRPFTDSEREVIIRQMEGFYEEFLDRVGKGRKMTREQVHEIAQGRVWTGAQALEVGLVDELGGLDRAIAIAREKAGIAPDTRVRVDVYPKKRTLIDLLLDEEMTSARVRQLTTALPEAFQGIVDVGRMMALLEKEPVLPLMPLKVTIR